MDGVWKFLLGFFVESFINQTEAKLKVAGVSADVSSAVSAAVYARGDELRAGMTDV